MYHYIVNQINNGLYADRTDTVPMIKKKFILRLIIATCAAALLPWPALPNQMGLGKALNVNAVGISVDYARTRYENDAGLYASYRYGFAHIVTLFFSADAGYRFLGRSVNVRAGGQAMFLFFGLEAGLLSAYRIKMEPEKWYERIKHPGPWAPGAYIGLAGVIPDKRLAIFLSAGGNFYFMHHDHEFYFMATAVVNFAGN